MLIVIIAAVALGGGDAEPARAFEFKQGRTVFAATLAGAALAFYALIGFEDSVGGHAGRAVGAGRSPGARRC